jgi:excisionase family DNA binding protein
MSDDDKEPAYTTFEVARLCGVYHTSVLHWIQKEKLKAYATPGGHHRVPRSELVAFMRRYDMPVPANMESSAKRLLIVDDDPLITGALLHSLGRLEGRYEITTVNNPVQGLVEVGHRLPDLLVLDLLMPALDGYEICRILKASPVTASIKIVAITASEPGVAQVDFLSRNADLLLRKPFDPRKLVEAVQSLLG